MNASVALLLLLLVCPVAMMLMMRGGRGHGSAGHDHSKHGDHLAQMSDEQLREVAQRAEQEIDKRDATPRKNA